MISFSMVPITCPLRIIRILRFFQHEFHHHIPPIQNEKYPWSNCGKKLPPLTLQDESYFNFHVKHGGKRLEHYSVKETIYTGGGDEVVGGDLILLCVRPNINSTHWKCFAERHFSLIHLNLFDDWPMEKFCSKQFIGDVEKEKQRQHLAEKEFLLNPLTSPYALPYQLQHE